MSRDLDRWLRVRRSPGEDDVPICKELIDLIVRRCREALGAAAALAV